eukprot:jgi/Picsp_1/1430/NSC_04909-R1_---NA---
MMQKKARDPVFTVVEGSNSLSPFGIENKENRYCQRSSGTGGPSTLGGLVAAGAACLGAGIVRRLVKKQFSLQGNPSL